MKRAVPFLIPLILMIGLIALGTSFVVSHTGRHWFERDIAEKSRLALMSARDNLGRNWSKGDIVKVRDILTEIARDERVMAAAVCGTNLLKVAETADFPKNISCRFLQSHLSIGSNVDQTSGGVVDLPDGHVYISTLPIIEGGTRLGFVVLIHDMRMIERRDDIASRFMILVFAVLAAAVSIYTILIQKITLRKWLRDVRSVVSGNRDLPEFRPLRKDVQKLISEITHDQDTGIPESGWSPYTLQNLLKKEFHGERMIIVANREPYIHTYSNGGISVLHPASGLVSALEPIMKACSGIWVAHGSGSADRETVDNHDRIKVPPGDEKYTLKRVWLSHEEESGYYYGFANEGLWPLCHIAHVRPAFRGSDWEMYRRVNERFADITAAEADVDDPVILVQDYHFSLLPRLLRERLPKSTILTFWHIPWPTAERLGICPWHDEIIKGLLGSNIIGFHTREHCNNFIFSVDRFLEARIDRERQGVIQKGFHTLVRPYPISIEWPPHWMKNIQPVDDCRREVVNLLGLKPDTLLGVGIDRMDYTKGIQERLLAVEKALELNPSLIGRLVFAQISAPSRESIEEYHLLHDKIVNLASRINSRFGQGSYKPIVLLLKHHEPMEVFTYFRAADFCYVSSLHDGMNLVAKEFVASRDDLRGVLILSSFTGAARELTEALIVNPYDIDQAARAIIAAVEMPPREQEGRMKAMRTIISEYNIYRWGWKMLRDAARLRQRQRLYTGLANLDEDT